MGLAGAIGQDQPDRDPAREIDWRGGEAVAGQGDGGAGRGRRFDGRGE